MEELEKRTLLPRWARIELIASIPSFPAATIDDGAEVDAEGVEYKLLSVLSVATET